MSLAFVTPFDKVFAVLEHGGPVVALSLDFVAQRPSPRMIPTFAFMDFLQHLCSFFLVQTSNIGAVKRTTKKDVVNQ